MWKNFYCCTKTIQTRSFPFRLGYIQAKNISSFELAQQNSAHLIARSADSSAHPIRLLVFLLWTKLFECLDCVVGTVRTVHSEHITVQNLYRTFLRPHTHLMTKSGDPIDF